MGEARTRSASRVWRLLLAAVGTVAVACCLQSATPTARGLGPKPQGPAATDSLGFPRTYHVYGREGAPGSLARYDMVVGYAYWNIRALRARNPKGIFLLQPGLHPRQAGDYRGVAVTYGNGLTTWRGGYDRLQGGPTLRRLRAFDPYWDQLHNADGSVALVNSIWKHEGWNLARFGVPQFVAGIFAYASKLDGLYTNGWDGIHSDNWIYRIAAGWFYGSDLDTDRDGRVDNFDSLARNWATGLTRLGLQLRSYVPGKIVGGNGNWNVKPVAGGTDYRTYMARPDDFLRSANYTLLEGLELYADQTDAVVRNAQEWLQYKDPRRQARYFAIIHKLPGGPKDYRSLRWGFSLSTIAGAYYEAYLGSHDDRLWYDEYDGGAGIRRRHWLGAPLSPPRKLSNGVWRRDYQNGVVLNNSTSSAQTVPLEGTFERLKGTQDPSVNDGATVTSATIPARDGLFLARPST